MSPADDVTYAQDLKKASEAAHEEGAHKADMAPSKQKKDITCKPCLFWLVALSLLPLAFLWAGWLGNRTLTDDFFKDPRTLLTLLAFIVALASYLSSVAREIIKKLGDKATEEDDKPGLKCNVAWTTVGESQLVALGLLLLLRIIQGPDPFIPTSFITEPIKLDNIIWAYLTLILVLLACLHVRVWCLVRPFSINR